MAFSTFPFWINPLPDFLPLSWQLISPDTQKRMFACCIALLHFMNYDLGVGFT